MEDLGRGEQGQARVVVAVVVAAEAVAEPGAAVEDRAEAAGVVELVLQRLELRISRVRRVLYGLKSLAALRHGEAATLTWAQDDATLQPLGGIHLGKTKSGVPRSIPVHATLAKMLAEWKLSGWLATCGRLPKASDLAVPTRNMTARQGPEAQEALILDLEALGLRVRAGARQNRRGHDMRRTFITLAQVDGVRRNLLEAVTHGPRGDIMSAYTTLPWPSLCDEISKLRISVREGTLVAFPTTAPLHAELRARNRWQKVVTPAGLEPALPT